MPGDRPSALGRGCVKTRLRDLSEGDFPSCPASRPPITLHAVVGLIGLSKRIAAPEAGHLSPDQAGIACIRRRMPIRETTRLML